MCVCGVCVCEGAHVGTRDTRVGSESGLGLWCCGVVKEWGTCTYVCTCVMYGMRVWCVCVVRVWCMCVCGVAWCDCVRVRTHVAGPPPWVEDVGVLYRRRVVVEDPLLLAARVPPAGRGGAHHGEVVVVLHGLVTG